MAGSEQKTHVSKTPRDLRAARIAELNDNLRKSDKGGLTVLSRRLALIAGAKLPELLKQIADFDKFDKSNDLKGERNGTTTFFAGQMVKWQIDYYDEEGLEPSKDPSDPAVTWRCMTIMLASEF